MKQTHLKSTQTDANIARWL